MVAKTQNIILKYWQPFLLFIFAASAIIFLYLFKLGSIIDGKSLTEIMYQHTAINLNSMLDNSLNLPYQIYNYILQHNGITSIASFRLFGLGFMFITSVIFYYLLKWRYDPFVAFLGSVLFTVSSWSLHIGRLATPEILLFSIVWLLYSARLLRSDNHLEYKTFFSLTILTILLYVPGMFWFLLLASFWQRRHIVDRYHTLGWKLCGPYIAWIIILLIPLGWTVTHSINTVPGFLGFPNNLPTFALYLHNLYKIPEYIFIRGPVTSDRWLGNLAILDVFSTAMFILGVYCLWLQRRLDFTQTLGGMFVVGCLLTALGGPVTISLLIPIVYIVIASGFALLLKEWLYVFPKNPLARGFGFGILIFAVVLIGLYHSDIYFVAWANNPVAKSFFKSPS